MAVAASMLHVTNLKCQFSSSGLLCKLDANGVASIEGLVRPLAVMAEQIPIFIHHVLIKLSLSLFNQPVYLRSSQPGTIGTTPCIHASKIWEVGAFYS